MEAVEEFALTMIIMFTTARGLLRLGKELSKGRLQIFCTEKKRLKLVELRWPSQLAFHYAPLTL